jgi:hypothetical protein
MHVLRGLESSRIAPLIVLWRHLGLCSTLFAPRSPHGVVFMRRSCALHSVPLPGVRIPSIIVLGSDLVPWTSIHAAMLQLWNVALKSDYIGNAESVLRP